MPRTDARTVVLCSQGMNTACNPNGRRGDDRLFTTLLSSAYSIQQQHDRIRSKVRAGRFNEIIGEVISTQSLIRKRNLDLDTAMHLVVNRTQKLARAAGAAIALLDSTDLDYKVGTGLGAMLLGLKVPANMSFSFERLRSEQWVETDTWQDNALARRLVARVLTAPICCHGVLAGCIQLFRRTGHFDADGIYACELMSAIVGQSIDGSGLRQSGGNFTRAVGGTWEFQRDIQLAAARPENSSGQRTDGVEHEIARRFESELKKPAMSARLESEKKARLSVDFTTKSPPPPIEHEIDCRPWEHKPGMDDLVTQPGAYPNHQDVAHASMLGFRMENPFVASRDMARAKQATGRRPEPSLGPPNLSDSLDHAQLSGEDMNDRAKSDVPGRKAWNRLKLIAYPVFVLVFAIIVRSNAGTHSWSLEILLYVLVVLTTLELRRRLLQR